MAEKTENVFDTKIDKTEQTETTVQPKTFDPANASDVAPGDKQKYIRPDLNGKEDVIENFQVFLPDTTKVPVDTGKSKYWSCNVTITYASENEEGVKNREYMSGVKCFEQNDGSISAPQYWYKGSGTQVAELYELVAKHLELEPSELSAKKFLHFLTGEPKVKLVGKTYDNWRDGKKQGVVVKNFPGEFI